jgi:serine/threonine-protein kinase
MVKLTLLDSKTVQPLQQWNFHHQRVIRIGRVKGNDLVLDWFPEISRYHLELRKLEPKNQWKLFNLGKNGTFVNGISINHCLLSHNALIQLAKNGPVLKFQIQSESLKPLKPLKKSLSSHCHHQGNSADNIFCIHCGNPLVEREEFVRHYQILKSLGQGGMGTTYLAYDRRTILRAQLSSNLLVLKEMNANLIAIPKARELFEREARILQSITHPSIPQYYEFFEDNKRQYLAMELVHGQNLEQLIYKTGPVTEKQAIIWMLQVCEILHYLHSLTPPIIHRDIKPANLMLRHLDQRVILLDFGAIKEIGTPWGTLIGAEGYSAPEQNSGKPCPQSDLYAIGPTLIFLLTGQNPLNYLKPEGKEFNFQIDHLPEITPFLASIITKTCRVKLGDRYQTVRELADDLRSHLQSRYCN